MEPRRIAFVAGVLALCAGFAAPSELRAQDDAEEAAEAEHPLVTRLDLPGVKSVDEDELRATLSTEPTRCRSFFLKPFCALTNSPIFEEKHRLDRNEIARDELRIRVFYWRRGWRDTRVATKIEPRGGGVAVTFAVTEGPPTVIDTVIVTQKEPRLTGRELRRAGLPRAGSPASLLELDTLESRVTRLLWDRGFADAVVADTLLPVAPLHVALTVDIDPKRKTTIGEIAIEGNEDVTERTVRRLLDLHEGQIFHRLDLLDAQRRLYRSELFRQALLTVPETPDSSKRLDVSLREAPLNMVRTGGGLNTIEFGQLQANYTRFNWIGTARRLELRATVGNLLAPQLYGKSIFGSAVPEGVTDDVDHAFLTPTWQLSASVSQPWLWSTRNAISATVFSSRRSIPGIVIDRGTGASATFTRRFAREVPVSFTYRYESTRIEAGDLYFCVNFGVCRTPTIEGLQQPASLSPFWVNVRAERTDDPLQPKTGFTARADLEHASALTASDWRYDRAEGEYARYFRVGRGTLVAHVRAGWVKPRQNALQLADSAADEALLHPRKRFYAGGARTVRGYAENQLGPRVLTIDPNRLVEPADTSRGVACTRASIADASCDPNVAGSDEFIPRPVGGNTMQVATVEYRFPLSKSTAGAVFVDAGRVGSASEGVNLHSRSAVTPGVGFRYGSPIGPIRIDLGIRPSMREELTVVTQVRDSTGVLHLVQLETPKAYDPNEGRGGFLRGVLGRLQLHLYIGEAY